MKSGSPLPLGDTRNLIDLLADKWTVPVLGALCDHGGRRRFNALRRDIPAISQKSLVQCLRRLQEHGLVQRQVFTEGPLAVEYAVTQLGRTLEAPVQAMLDWSARHAGDVEAARQAFKQGRA